MATKKTQEVAVVGEVQEQLPKLSGRERKEYARLKAVIASGFVELGAAIIQIRDGKLYREEFATFELFCNEQVGISRQRAYQLIDASAVTQEMIGFRDENGEPLPMPANEYQARELAKVADPEERRAVWADVISGAAGKTPTAEEIASVIAKRESVLTPRVGTRVGKPSEDETPEGVQTNGVHVDIPGAPTTPSEVATKEEVAPKPSGAPAKKKAQAAEREEILDALGNEVPDGLRDVFADPTLPEETERVEAWWKAMADEYKGVIQRLGKKVSAYHWLKFDILSQLLTDGHANLRDATHRLQTAAPYAVCGYCKGTGCSECRTSGYVPRWRYEEIQKEKTL